MIVMEEVKISKDLEEELEFKAELQPQTSLVNSKYFQIDSRMVYKLDRVEKIFKYELIYNGKYLLVFANLFDSTKKHLLIYKPPQDGSTKVLKACKEFEIPMDYQTYFVLNSGNIIAIIPNRYNEDETWFYRIILDLSLNIECFKIKLYQSRVSESSNNELCYSRCYAISGDLLAFGFAVIDYLEYETECDLVKVFDCSSQITEVLDIDVSKFTEFRLVNNLCFLDNNKKLAIITSHLEYIIVDILSGVGEIKEINFLPTFYKEHIYPLIFVNIQYESIDREIVLILTDEGFILNMNKEKCISLGDKIQQNFHDNSIISSYLCVFNKWIYIFCTNLFIYVYDPFHEAVVHEFNASSLNREISIDWFNEKIRIDWFGDQLFYKAEDKIIVQQIFRHKCFSLRYIARKALFKYHSENDLKELKLGKKINQLIFDNIY